eukprot:750444_1
MARLQRFKPFAYAQVTFTPDPKALRYRVTGMIQGRKQKREERKADHHTMEWEIEFKPTADGKFEYCPVLNGGNSEQKNKVKINSIRQPVILAFKFQYTFLRNEPLSYYQYWDIYDQTIRFKIAPVYTDSDIPGAESEWSEYVANGWVDDEYKPLKLQNKSKENPRM